MKFEVLPISNMDKSWQPLVDAAVRVQPRAYAPYSQFKVASAIEDENGKIHIGVNVENSNYGGTPCAERNASTRMIADGGTKIRRIVVLTPTEKPCFPCGACLQAIAEFQSNTVVLSVSGDLSVFMKADFSDLFPAAFTPDRLDEGRL